MNSWAIKNLSLNPHAPEILASCDDARAIALLIPADESLDDHQVHERAWVTMLDGEVEFTTTTGESITGNGAVDARDGRARAGPAEPEVRRDVAFVRSDES